MPQSRRYKKKKSAGKAILAWIIVLAILVAAVFVFVSFFYEDTKKKLDEMNYPRTYSTYVEKAAKDYDLDPALIYAVIGHIIHLKVQRDTVCVSESRIGRRSKGCYADDALVL